MSPGEYCRYGSWLSMKNSDRLRLREVKGVATLAKIEGDLEKVWTSFAFKEVDLMAVDPLE